MKNLLFIIGLLATLVLSLYCIDFHTEPILQKLNYQLAITVVVGEIVGFLAIAWILGFFVAWSIFRPIQLEYKSSMEDKEDSINYLNTIIKNQEKEITKLTRDVQRLTNPNPQHTTKKFLDTQKKKQKSNNKKPQIKKLAKSENRILKEIEATLEKIN